MRVNAFDIEQPVQNRGFHGEEFEQPVQNRGFHAEESVEYDQCLSKAALRINQSFDIEAVLNKTVNDVRRVLDTDRVVIFRFESDSSGMAVVESVMDHWPSMLGQMIHDSAGKSNWVQPYRNGQVQVTADIHVSGLSPDCIAALDYFHVRANLVVPIFQEAELNENPQPSKLWGLLAAQQCGENRHWQPSEIEFMQKLVTHIEWAIHKADLYAMAQTELLERQRAEAEVYRLRSELETKMGDRLTELREINQTLRQEIRERRSIERTLYAEKELAQITLEAIGDAVITTDAWGNIQYFNPVAEHLTGWKLNEVKGLPLTDIFNIVNEITRRTVENPLHKVLRSGQVASLANNTVLIARDGTEYPIEDSAAPIRASNGEIIGVVLVFHDVTQSRYLARQLSWQANHDDLTGLFNRRTFERQLTDAVVEARSQKQHHVLCFLDLDRFKAVNDTCGHAAGDALLCQVTNLLQERVRITDTLARLGGDEFGLLLHQCSLEEAEQVADALRQLIQDFQFHWQGKVFTIGVSIGLVAINADSQNLNTVLNAADAACYAAKERGRNCIYVYQNNDVKLEQQRTERQWISRLDQALREDRFCLYSQKIASVGHTCEPEHHEILLRLVDESGELVPPMAFIPAAERYHLIPVIDQWVIRTFFSQYQQYCQESAEHQKEQANKLYTINLSGGSVNSDEFLGFVKDQFTEHNIPPQNICFEITETTAIANLDQAAQFINSLKTLGCRFALDDFGSGMSSLAYLKTLPVDYLKIDGGFVKDIDSDQMDYAMVECFNHLSHLMGIQTIAECVESDLVLQKLLKIGVDFVQGFCIDRPSPLVFAGGG